MPAAGCLALLTRECQILAHPTQQYSVIGIELPAAIVAAINRKTEHYVLRPARLGRDATYPQSTPTTGRLRNAAVPRGFERHKQRPLWLRRPRQPVRTGVLYRKASSSICLTRKSATSAREMNPHVQRRGSTNAR